MTPSHESIQFNSIDPARINSHFGVRTDLFRRPLSKTRITDFFGGVAQAEIDSPSSPYSPLEESELDESDLDVQEQRKSECNSRFLHPSPVNQVGLQLHRTLRAWGSVLLLGILLGWVSSRKRVPHL